MWVHPGYRPRERVQEGLRLPERAFAAFLSLIQTRRAHYALEWPAFLRPVSPFEPDCRLPPLVPPRADCALPLCIEACDLLQLSSSSQRSPQHACVPAGSPDALRAGRCADPDETTDDGPHGA